MFRMKHDEASVLVRLGIAGNIRAIRRECGHTQTAFAEMISVNRSYISQIERGRGNISIDVLVKIADGLDRPVTDFFRGLESGPPRTLTWESISEALERQPKGKKPLSLHEKPLIHYESISLPNVSDENK